MEKIAVLSTSDIQRVTDYDLMRIESTGKLERALEQGFTVYVGSTRTKTGDHDQWWIDLVGSNNVFLADDIRVHTCENHNELANSGWLDLFTSLGFDWPLEGDAARNLGRTGKRMSEPMFWTSAVPWMYTAHDIAGPGAFDGE
jgi:hypothetical protein